MVMQTFFVFMMIVALINMYFSFLASGVSLLKEQREREMISMVSNSSYEELLFYASNFTNASAMDNASMVLLVQGHSDLKKDICHQAIVEICLNLQKECGGQDVRDVWGWAISCADGNCDSLEEGSDYIVVSSIPTDSIGSFVKLSDIPYNRTDGNCSDKVIYGQYLYHTKVRLAGLGCDLFKLDLNKLELRRASCAVMDVLKN